jgi:Holliday junction resolvase RusA-like endonuclease
MAEYEFEIPVPPSVNRYWMVANNRIIVTTEARNYKQKIFYQLANKLEPLRGDVAINFTVYRPMKRGDLDNYCKVMLDALNGICWLDDSQIVEIHAFRDDDKINPHVKFLVYEIEERK